MDAGDITPIGQIEPLGGVGEIKVPQLVLADRRLRQMRPEEGLEMSQAGVRVDREKHRRQLLRQWPRVSDQQLKRLLAIEALVVLVEAAEKTPAVGVDKPLQIGLALRVV